MAHYNVITDPLKLKVYLEIVSVRDQLFLLTCSHSAEK